MSAPVPICPKCGYDQSGEVATWENQCPTDGTCPECGLGFAWREVMRPLIDDLPWYIEHARSMRARVWRTPGTLRRLILPHVFWRGIDVRKRVAIPSLLVWCVLVCIGAHLLVAIPVGLGDWQENNWLGTSLRQYYNQYGFSAITAILFNGISLPLYRADPVPMASLFGVNVRQTWWDTEELMRVFFRPIGFQLGFIALWLTVLLAMPRTRRLTKLRGAHIARAALLSMTAMVLTFEFYRLNEALNGLGGYRTGITSRLYIATIPMMIAWQIAFWGSAIIFGWRIRPWRLLVVVGTLAALLGGATLRVYAFLSTTT